MGDRISEELIGALENVLGPHLRNSAALRHLARAAGAWLLAQVALAENTDISEKKSPGQSSVEPHHASADSGVSGGEPLSLSSVSAPCALKSASCIAGPQVVLPASARVVPLRLGEPDTSVKEFEHAGGVSRVHATGDAEGVQFARSASIAEPESTLDLDLIATRSSLKAEACRVFVRRRAAAFGSDDEKECIAEVHRLLEKAKSMQGCLLWMFFREYEHPDDESMEQIARWYDAHAQAARVLLALGAEHRPHREDLVQAMQLLAHANAGLRAALEPTWLPRPDIDQEEGHLWLRWETKTQRVLVPRYMRRADRPDADSLEELFEKLAVLTRIVEDRARHAADTSHALKRIRYHAELLADGRSLDDAHDWGRIESSLEELAAMGIAPTDARVLTALEELAETNIDPEVLGTRVVAALAALHEIVAQAEAEDVTAQAASRPWSERVHEVRRWLAGRSVVIVGGEERRKASSRLIKAFGLAGVEWVALPEHSSGSALRAPIERPETALVLLLIKLAGHHHVDEAKRYAKAAGKPIVLLKAGYNPERVAFAILNQASDQLKAGASSREVKTTQPPTA